ncbi:SGNH/GDSL hydrolase family protein [Spirillospora sp. CA-255316]
MIATGPITGADAAGLDGGYVALGDSYASGPGVPNTVPDSGPCARSDHNYASLIAQAVKPTSFTDVTCGGAVTGSITGSFLGQPPQLDAVKADTKLVTLTIGGNDAGLLFAGSICIALGYADPNGAPCKWWFTNTGTDTLLAGVDATVPKIANVIGLIKQKAPNAKVLFVGYPDVVPESKAKCALPDQPLAVGDVPYLYDVIKQINQKFGAGVTAAGAIYVDTFTPSIGHDACQLPGVRWVEGISDIQNGGPLHPNTTGMQGMANAALSQLS